MTLNKLIPLLFLIIFFGCKKDKKVSGSGSVGASTPVVFSGFTVTDNLGAANGVVDSTDWTYDKSWTQSEKQLFMGFKSNLDSCFKDAGISIFPAYANPTTGTFSLAHKPVSNTLLNLRIVNKKFEKIVSADSVSSGTIAIKLDGLINNTDTLVRVYYLFTRNDSCVYKGHGDVRVN